MIKGDSFYTFYKNFKFDNFKIQVGKNNGTYRCNISVVS